MFAGRCVAFARLFFIVFIFLVSKTKRMRYGIPYKGSKSKIAHRIFQLFPPADNFYDLFAGGCAMTHYALENKNYKNYIINDINPMPTQLFRDAINGKYQNETRWISREDFLRLKDTDAYIRYCWSFGNNGDDYLYAREIEPWKKALHFARVLGDFSLLEDMGIESAKSAWIIKHQAECKDKYIKWYTAKFLQNPVDTNEAICDPLLGARLEALERLQNLESLQRLQSLQSLQRLQRLQSLQGDYSVVKIAPRSIIYCDIPY